MAKHVAAPSIRPNVTYRAETSLSQAMHKRLFRQAWFFTRQVGRGRSSQSHERERRRVRHFRPRRDGDGARVGVAQDRKVAVAEEDFPRRRRRRRDARGPPAERARVRGRARRRRPLEISEPRRRRLSVAGDDAVRRVDDARARRGPPAAAEGRVGERRVEVAVVAPPAFFEFVVLRPRATPGREKTFSHAETNEQAHRSGTAGCRRRGVSLSWLNRLVNSSDGNIWSLFACAV